MRNRELGDGILRDEFGARESGSDDADWLDEFNGDNANNYAGRDCERNI